MGVLVCGILHMHDKNSKNYYLDLSSKICCHDRTNDLGMYVALACIFSRMRRDILSNLSWNPSQSWFRNGPGNVCLRSILCFIRLSSLSGNERAPVTNSDDSVGPCDKSSLLFDIAAADMTSRPSQYGTSTGSSCRLRDLDASLRSFGL